MLYFYFFSAKNMTQGIPMRKKSCPHYGYSRMNGPYKDGVSLTLKEVSLQMADDEERRRVYALLTCLITVIFDIFLGAAAFVCAAITDSSAGYAFALDCLLDVIAATFVIWRFYGTTSTHSDFKETVTCICLGVLFCLAAIGISVKSILDLASHTIPQQELPL